MKKSILLMALMAGLGQQAYAMHEGPNMSWANVPEKCVLTCWFVYAGERYSSEVIDNIIRDGRIDVNATEEYCKKTALHIASASGCIKNVKVIVKATGIDLDKQDPDGDTALHKAALSGHYKVVQLLIEHGANINIQNIYGETALLITIRPTPLEDDPADRKIYDELGLDRLYVMQLLILAGINTELRINEKHYEEQKCNKTALEIAEGYATRKIISTTQKYRGDHCTAFELKALETIKLAIKQAKAQKEDKEDKEEQLQHTRRIMQPENAETAGAPALFMITGTNAVGGLSAPKSLF